jgi:hypothetical protein
MSHVIRTIRVRLAVIWARKEYIGIGGGFRISEKGHTASAEDAKHMGAFPRKILKFKC